MRLLQKILICLLIPCLILIGCVRNQEQDALQSGDKVSLHVIHSEKLRGIMQRIRNLMDNRELTVTLVDELREKYMQTLIDTADDLVFAAETLSLQGPVDKLDQEEETEFRAIAGRFYEDAVNLHLKAMDSNFMEMDSAYNKLDETCNGCHRLFRSD